MRNANATPPARVSRWVPPQHGRSPSPTSGKAIDASGPTIRRSAASTSSAPAPTAGPFHTATVGAGNDARSAAGSRSPVGVATRGSGRAQAVERTHEERARRIVDEVVERREQPTARGTADVGERSGRQVDRGDAGDVRPPAQPPTRASASTSARSSGVSAHAVVAAALARTCSGEVAPAITLPTVGAPASHESASSGSV